MTKYYRVRTQEQWDWLKNKLEIEDDLHVSDFPMTLLYGDVFCGIYKYHDDPEPLIEVSQMMEESKMEDYVTIKGNDLFEIKNEAGHTAFIGRAMGTFYSDDYFTKLNIPKSLLYPKVKMTETEKKEFDELKRHRGTVYGALDMIEDDYPKLYTRLFGNSSHEGESKAQLEFARAWADPSLIEVIPEKKWNVKIPPFSRTNNYYFKVGKNLESAESEYNGDEDQQFTADELKEYGLDDDMYEKEEVKE